MGKRLQRYSGEHIYTNHDVLMNVELHLVLLNGASFHGTIEKWDKDTCYFKDYRSHIQRISIADIAEIVTDITSPY